MDWFYRLWVVPVAAVTWFGAAILLCFLYLPLGLLALVVAAILFEGLLSHASAKKPGARDAQHPPQ